MSDVYEASDVDLVDDNAESPDQFGGERPARIVGGVLGLMGFVTALLVGLLNANPGLIIVTRALVALIVCCVIGRIIGRIGEICVEEFLMRYREENPIPGMPEALKRLYKKRADQEALKGQFTPKA